MALAAGHFDSNRHDGAEEHERNRVNDAHSKLRAHDQCSQRYADDRKRDTDAIHSRDSSLDTSQRPPELMV